MGLDMYLYMNKYEVAHCYKIENGKKLPKNFYPKELEQLKQDILKRSFLSKETKYHVGYWRKFNALHWWIVKNCANEEDNCGEIYLSVEDIEKLLKVCLKVMMDHSKASELLPSKSGFFFGNTEYDDWYFDNLEYTINLLQKIIELIKKQTKEEDPDSAAHCYEWDIIYQASW